MRDWSARRWATAVVGAVGVGLAIGLPTELVPNPVFHRMLPVEWWHWPAWVAASALAGLVLATYVRDRAATAPARLDAAGGSGGVLAFLAVGCAVCNKLVVAALGTTGATTWFAPAQPVLALGALGLLALALRGRLRAERACPLPEDSADRA